MIYTGEAMLGLRFSENDGAFEELGLDSIVTDGVLNWSAMMFCAMRADVLTHPDFPTIDD